MKILVGCEVSGSILLPLLSLDHDAYSCDILSAAHDRHDRHIQADIRDLLDDDWDFIFAFPPCTYLSKAGLHYNLKSVERQQKTLEAMQLVKDIYYSRCPSIMIENPPGYLSTGWMQPQQIIKPAYFGDPYHKEICLWLKNTPPIISTCFNPKTKSIDNHINSRMTREERASIRSSWRYYPGMVRAIIHQVFTNNRPQDTTQCQEKKEKSPFQSDYTNLTF
jgi:site-specific DNA-cytosine methylase